MLKKTISRKMKELNDDTEQALYLYDRLRGTQ